MPNEVNVLELARGAIQEQINGEMEKVMSNILDPNTDPKAARKLTITLTMKPNENNREIVNFSAQAKSTLVPIKPITTSIFVEADHNGRPKAAELTRSDPNQTAIFEDEPKVIKLAK